MIRRPPRELKIPGSNPVCTGIFSGSSYTNGLRTGTPVATLPSFVGSALVLVGPVLVYCDWVRWKVWSATSISVWQRVKLSEKIRPSDTLACCWDVKQPTSKQLFTTPGRTTPHSTQLSTTRGYSQHQAPPHCRNLMTTSGHQLQHSLYSTAPQRSVGGHSVSLLDPECVHQWRWLDRRMPCLYLCCLKMLHHTKYCINLNNDGEYVRGMQCCYYSGRDEEFECYALEQ